jgi:hypothetical protein
MKFGRKNGQSVLEFTVLLLIVIGVFIAMNLYVKRGIQGRWKATLDDFGEQYDPALTNSNIVYTTNGMSATQIQTIKDVGGYWTQRVDNSTTTSATNGLSSVGAEF